MANLLIKCMAQYREEFNQIKAVLYLKSWIEQDIREMTEEQLNKLYPLLDKDLLVNFANIWGYKGDIDTSEHDRLIAIAKENLKQQQQKPLFLEFIELGERIDKVQDKEIKELLKGKLIELFKAI